MNRLRSAAIALAVFLAGPSIIAASPEQQALVEPCLECHSDEDGSPAHQVLLGSHGIDGDEADLAGRRGCLDCHGDSANHIAKPRKAAPDVSFGPRWTTDPGEQDAPCLSCHEDDAAQNWRHALHMVNDLTCVTCHDIHAEQDKVLVEDQQFTVCTTCHKAQKTGIHDLGQGNDPACSLCHNPHNHEAAESKMRANASAGCVVCHDDQQMNALMEPRPDAGNLHPSLAGRELSCIDCHQHIAHAAEDSAPPLHPKAVSQRPITLFYPGNASREWLTSEHPGSQPLRQGTSCQRCHRGEEALLGRAMAPGLEPSSREIDIAFSRAGDQLHIELQWPGTVDDRQLALMWGEQDNLPVSRGGCFAACHDAGPGENTAPDHLLIDPLQTTMGGLDKPRQAAEQWRIQLDDGSVQTALAGHTVKDQPTNTVSASSSFNAGLWTVNLAIELNGAGPGISFGDQGRYTFGIALHGPGDEGREHLVSLPMTLGLNTRDTDFTCLQDPGT